MLSCQQPVAPHPPSACRQVTCLIGTLSPQSIEESLSPDRRLAHPPPPPTHPEPHSALDASSGLWSRLPPPAAAIPWSYPVQSCVQGTPHATEQLALPPSLQGPLPLAFGPHGGVCSLGTSRGEGCGSNCRAMDWAGGRYVGPGLTASPAGGAGGGGDAIFRVGASSGSRSGSIDSMDAAEMAASATRAEEARRLDMQHQAQRCRQMLGMLGEAVNGIDASFRRARASLDRSTNELVRFLEAHPQSAATMVEARRVGLFDELITPLEKNPR